MQSTLESKTSELAKELEREALLRKIKHSFLKLQKNNVDCDLMRTKKTHQYSIRINTLPSWKKSQPIIKGDEMMNSIKAKITYL